MLLYIMRDTMIKIYIKGGREKIDKKSVRYITKYMDKKTQIVVIKHLIPPFIIIK